jgi:hypothetical protein
MSHENRRTLMRSPDLERPARVETLSRILRTIYRRINCTG